ncbi:MAG: hypothetical protein S4CHLAM37_02960 [Chlamydiia bacterium]|nr:hypothetical protein [Chlamydiia bacterium]
MNKHASEYYQSKKENNDAIFDEVIALHEKAAEFEFSDLQSKSKRFPKGFFELAKLTKKDRIDFTCSFWEATLPYSPKLHEFLTLFFARVDDIGVYLVKREVDPELTPHLVYSLSDEESFYRGLPSAIPEEVEMLKSDLQLILPEDFLGFLKVHNGFAKDGDFGMIQVNDVLSEMSVVQNEAMQMTNKPIFQQKPIDPSCLIPFYKSNGFNVYECFYKGWYPEKEMGNVLLSLGEGRKIDYSDPTTRIKKLAFPTFLDWLMNYMEPFNV